MDSYLTAASLAVVSSSGKGMGRPDSDRRCEGDFHGLVGQSPAMQRSYEAVRRAAPAKHNVLILGESGTGKEDLARAVHARSLRAAGPFITVNSATLTGQTLESSLFGHEKGAFTDADHARPGLVALAHGGTLFFDEIGELPLELQAKLLRVVQFGEVHKLGAAEPQRYDVRFVAATNLDMKKAIPEGRFRRDLYERFAEVELRVPPLRHRPGDMPPLVAHLIAQDAIAGPEVKATPEALGWLAALPYPGNVRELQRIVRRALMYRRQEDLITLADLQLAYQDEEPEAPVGMAPSPSASGPVMTMDEVEKKAVVEAIARNDGNKTAAARELRISRSRLQRIEKLIAA